MLTNIVIKNFKAIRSADMPLRAMTLLTGLNAVGKSSIIQALLLLRTSFNRGGKAKQGLMLKNEEYISLGLGKDVFSIGSPSDAPLRMVLQFDFTYEWEFEFAQAPDQDFLPLLLADIRGDIEVDGLTLFDYPFQYLSANRINPQSQYKTSPYYVDVLESLGKEGQYTVHYLARNQDKSIPNKALIHPLAKSDTLLDNVSAWMSEISPGVKVNTTYHEELEIASLSYNFEIASGYTDNFKPSNVGFGVTYALPVITALLMLPVGGILLIENPESHLHPAGQSKIAHLCALAAASGVQVILESHSDHVLNGIRVAVKQQDLSPEDIAVYYFQRERDSKEHETQIIPIHIDEHGRADEWPEGFFDEWDKQLDMLLED